VNELSRSAADFGCLWFPRSRRTCLFGAERRVGRALSLRVAITLTGIHTPLCSLSHMTERPAEPTNVSVTLNVYTSTLNSHRYRECGHTEMAVACV
jgi:hypothetical protein